MCAGVYSCVGRFVCCVCLRLQSVFDIIVIISVSRNPLPSLPLSSLLFVVLTIVAIGGDIIVLTVILTVVSVFPDLIVYFGEYSVTVTDCNGGQNNENEIQRVINRNFPLDHRPYMQKRYDFTLSAGGNDTGRRN